MAEQLREEYQTPWEMPQDIFWDYSEGAELRRLQWLQDNRPDVSLREMYHVMPFRAETFKELLDSYREERNNNG